LTLTGELLDGTPIEGQDCVVIIKKEQKPLNIRRSQDRKAELLGRQRQE